MNPTTPTLRLSCVNDQVYRVDSAQGEHLGNLKLIGASWKFKAVGYDDQGRVEPGGGPLTHQHNQVFETLDVAEISARLLRLGET
jgi:hypothetical protein